MTSRGRRAAAALKRFVFITPQQYLIGWAPAMNAAVGGHFARHGLEADIVAVANAPMAVQQTVVRRADAVRGSASEIANAVGNQGTQLLAIGTIFYACSFLVVSRKAKPVPTATYFTG